MQAGAQTREVEVFYDRYGREVLVDIYTGEVVAVREPRGSVREFGVRPRENWGDSRRQDGYYLDQRDYDAQLRRERRLQELEREPYGDQFPDYRDYRAAPGPDFRESPDGFGGYGDDVVREEPWQEPLQPPVNDQVERVPLGTPSIAELPAPNTNGDVIIDDASPSALPDVTQPPQIGRLDATEDVAKIQILLDRAGASPGVIDGRIGDNVNKAIDGYRALTGKTLRTYDTEFIEAELAATGGDPFTTYEITPTDVAGPYVASIPSDYGEKSRMERMGYISVAEMLAERFHMDERYLRSLNPGVNFDRPGTVIKVVNIGEARSGTVMRIIADKGRKQVRAYDTDGALVAVYPSTIGSAATPSPTGTHNVERIALDPQYTYNPKINFQQGDNTKVLTIPPGPNGPVGTVWIALSKPTYGIHGTPEPSQIGKTESNGCIRLTNWDARELAQMVEVGATVEFVE
ncbi:L,D-transpeptidase [Mesorhizobium sp. CAU 1741]|uniref:L,D-transpeptidase family protein n=1 Tax=Mesorhizobium sp. CAU 1741 TaxID=3140366 RepID=UPI00325BC5E2